MTCNTLGRCHSAQPKTKKSGMYYTRGIMVLKTRMSVLLCAVFVVSSYAK